MKLNSQNFFGNTQTKKKTVKGSHDETLSAAESSLQETLKNPSRNTDPVQKLTSKELTKTKPPPTQKLSKKHPKKTQRAPIPVTSSPKPLQETPKKKTSRELPYRVNSPPKTLQNHPKKDVKDAPITLPENLKKRQRAPIPKLSSPKAPGKDPPPKSAQTLRKYITSSPTCMRRTGQRRSTIPMANPPRIREDFPAFCIRLLGSIWKHPNQLLRKKKTLFLLTFQVALDSFGPPSQHTTGEEVSPVIYPCVTNIEVFNFFLLSLLLFSHLFRFTLSLSPSSSFPSPFSPPPPSLSQPFTPPSLPHSPSLSSFPLLSLLHPLSPSLPSPLLQSFIPPSFSPSPFIPPSFPLPLLLLPPPSLVLFSPSPRPPSPPPFTSWPFFFSFLSLLYTSSASSLSSSLHPSSFLSFSSPFISSFPSIVPSPLPPPSPLPSSLLLPSFLLSFLSLPFSSPSPLLPPSPTPPHPLHPPSFPLSPSLLSLLHPPPFLLLLLHLSSLLLRFILALPLLPLPLPIPLHPPFPPLPFTPPSIPSPSSLLSPLSPPPIPFTLPSFPPPFTPPQWPDNKVLHALLPFVYWSPSFLVLGGAAPRPEPPKKAQGSLVCGRRAAASPASGFSGGNEPHLSTLRYGWRGCRPNVRCRDAVGA
ncbi:hypothetical protein C7M84_003052 [Penaeus vannamei]|uniref:Uncharacterized protein n=1 Tax=Penaeus vannamei TaxID=6689 RepID=A0A423TP58_PENVA|nr:hypothetical protein C7M84_003052 [Penaeus vannamei]